MLGEDGREGCEAPRLPLLGGGVWWGALPHSDTVGPGWAREPRVGKAAPPGGFRALVRARPGGEERFGKPTDAQQERICPRGNRAGRSPREAFL